MIRQPSPGPGTFVLITAGVVPVTARRAPPTTTAPPMPSVAAVVTPRQAAGSGDPATPTRQGVSVSQTSDFGPDLSEVFGPQQAAGGPELVQLLTPEGERVEHPDFSF